jgi:hypothetical protein
VAASSAVGVGAAAAAVAVAAVKAKSRFPLMITPFWSPLRNRGALGPCGAYPAEVSNPIT